MSCNYLIYYVGVNTKFTKQNFVSKTPLSKFKITNITFGWLSIWFKSDWITLRVTMSKEWKKYLVFITNSRFFFIFFDNNINMHFSEINWLTNQWNPMLISITDYYMKMYTSDVLSLCKHIWTKQKYIF